MDVKLLREEHTKQLPKIKVRGGGVGTVNPMLCAAHIRVTSVKPINTHYLC